MIMDLLRDLVHARGVAAVLATHDPLLVERADRVVDLHGGAPSSARHAGAAT
jgi:putative ABC transport system ATP-binding protein